MDEAVRIAVAMHLSPRQQRADRNDSAQAQASTRAEGTYEGRPLAPVDEALWTIYRSEHTFVKRNWRHDRKNLAKDWWNGQTYGTRRGRT
jgi:hypothetical protein